MTTYQKNSNALRLVGILTVFAVVVGGLIFMTHSANDNDVVEISTCIPIQGVVSNKTVVLRVDDIQAYSWSSTTKLMVIDAGNLGIPLTLGVIPAGLQDDKELINFLKSQECRVEFALHGFTHYSGEDGSVPEFGTLNKDQALISISSGLDILRTVTVDPIVTWIPPLNVHSKGTIAALQELGFKYLSTEGVGVFDYDAATFRYDKKALVSPDKVVETCLTTFEKSSYCIIMLHPQDFADGLEHSQEKYERYYLGLLKALKSEGFTFARFRQLPSETQ